MRAAHKLPPQPQVQTAFAQVLHNGVFLELVAFAVDTSQPDRVGRSDPWASPALRFHLWIAHGISKASILPHGEGSFAAGEGTSGEATLVVRADVMSIARFLGSSHQDIRSSRQKPQSARLMILALDQVDPTG